MRTLVCNNISFDHQPRRRRRLGVANRSVRVATRVCMRVFAVKGVSNLFPTRPHVFPTHKTLALAYQTRRRRRRCARIDLTGETRDARTRQTFYGEMCSGV